MAFNKGHVTVNRDVTVGFKIQLALAASYLESMPAVKRFNIHSHNTRQKDHITYLDITFRRTASWNRIKEEVNPGHLIFQWLCPEGILGPLL